MPWDVRFNKTKVSNIYENEGASVLDTGNAQLLNFNDVIVTNSLQKVYPMRALKIAFLSASVAILTAGSVFAAPLDGCQLESRADSRASGRFIWKPTGAHFNQSVIVAPRRYYPIPPEVKLYTLDQTLIERASLKSDGLCKGHPECLFAATYLTRKNGSFYRRRHTSIIVRIVPRRVTATAYCKYFQISNPGRRAEYKG